MSDNKKNLVFIVQDCFDCDFDEAVNCLNDLFEEMREIEGNELLDIILEGIE